MPSSFNLTMRYEQTPVTVQGEDEAMPLRAPGLPRWWGRGSHSPSSRERLCGGGDLSWPWSDEQDLEREEEQKDGGKYDPGPVMNGQEASLKVAECSLRTTWNCRDKAEQEGWGRAFLTGSRVLTLSWESEKLVKVSEQRSNKIRSRFRGRFRLKRILERMWKGFPLCKKGEPVRLMGGGWCGREEDSRWWQRDG